MNKTEIGITTRRIALLLFFLALTFRAVYLFQIQPLPFTMHPSLDAASYDNWGQEIAAGNWLGERAFYQAPLYPYLLGVLYKFFGHHLNLIRLLQMLLGALNCVLVFWTALRIFGKRQALWSGALALFYGILVFYEGAIGKDGPSVFLTDLTLLGLILSWQRPKWYRWFGSGLALGCAVLTRGNLVLLAPLMAIWIVMVLRKHPRSTVFTAIGAFTAGTVLMISPATIRNYVVSKDLVLTTSQAGQNFYIGNNPNANGFFENPERIRLNPKYEEDDFIAEALRITGRAAMKPSEVSGFWFRRGIDFIVNNPAKALGLLVKKTALFWNQFEIPDNYNYYFYKNEVWILNVLFLGFGIVAPLGLLGLVLARKNPGTWLFALFVLGYMASIVPFHMASRYRLPVVPPLVLFAGYSLFWAMERFREKNYRPILYAVVPLGFFATVVHWNVADESQSFKAPFTELGIIAAESGDYDKAKGYFEKAIEIDPDYAPAQYNLGNVLVKSGRFKEAIAAYQNALKSDPEFLMAYDNLGKAYLRLGFFDEALESFHRALRVRPDYAEAAAGTGLVYHSMGFYDKAIEAYQQAIAYNPRYASGYYNLACAYGKKGDIKNARLALKKAVELNPEYKQKAKYDSDLEILKWSLENKEG